MQRKVSVGPIPGENEDAIAIHDLNRGHFCRAIVGLTWLRLPKTLSGMTRGWAYGNEAADGRVSEPAAACYPVAVRAASAA